MTDEKDPTELKRWDNTRVRTEIKVISHVGTPTGSANPFIHGETRRVFFADGTYADTWAGSEVTNQVADRSLVGLPLEVTFSGSAIIGIKHFGEASAKREPESRMDVYRLDEGALSWLSDQVMQAARMGLAFRIGVDRDGPDDKGELKTKVGEGPWSMPLDLLRDDPR